MKPETPFKAVVSPCSECKNYRTETTTEGLPACPRRVWEERNEASRSRKPVEPPPDYLLATGTDSKDRLSNPVYYQDGLTIAIWAAPLLDNRVTFGKDGAVVNGNILNREAFDTRYIQCRSVPFLPLETWAEMIGKGAYKEWDQLLVIPALEDQEASDPGALPDQQPLCKTGGFVKRVDFTFSSTQTSPQSDRLMSGI